MGGPSCLVEFRNPCFVCFNGKIPSIASLVRLELLCHREEDNATESQWAHWIRNCKSFANVLSWAAWVVWCGEGRGIILELWCSNFEHIVLCQKKSSHWSQEEWSGGADFPKIIYMTPNESHAWHDTAIKEMRTCKRASGYGVGRELGSDGHRICDFWNHDISRPPSACQNFSPCVTWTY